MTIKPGDKLPAVEFTVKTADGNQKVSTDVVFAGRKVVLFGLPGAFTPTCNMNHLPGFLLAYDDFKAKGVDTIACVSVNDVFVMKAWGEDQKVGDDILLLADGSGNFTREIGLEMDANRFGMGTRSQRYSMIVKDGVVTELNVEAGGEFRVSSAEYLLEQL